MPKLCQYNFKSKNKKNEIRNENKNKKKVFICSKIMNHKSIDYNHFLFNNLINLIFGKCSKKSSYWLF